jgi:excisionase family DNA binding protein
MALVREVLRTIEGERSLVQVPREALTAIADEFYRLRELLDEDRLWDPLDVARFLGISRNTVYAQVDSGALPCVRIGGLLKFDPERIRAIGRGEMLSEGRGRVAALPVATGSRKR